MTQNHRCRAFFFGIGNIANALQCTGRPAQAEFCVALRKTFKLFDDVGIWHALMNHMEFCHFSAMTIHQARIRAGHYDIVRA